MNRQILSAAHRSPGQTTSRLRRTAIRIVSSACPFMPRKFTVDKSGNVRFVHPRLRVQFAPMRMPAKTGPPNRRNFSRTHSSVLVPAFMAAKIFCIPAIPISNPATRRAKITAARSEKALAPRKNSTQFVTVTIPSMLYVLQPLAKNGCSDRPLKHGEMPPWKPIIHIHRCRSDRCLTA